MIYERYFLQLHILCVSGKEKCWLSSSLCQLQVNYAKIATIQIATYKFLYTAQIKLNGVHILPNKFNVRQWQAIYCLRAVFSFFRGTSFAVYVILISQLFRLLHSNDAYFLSTSIYNFINYLYLIYNLYLIHVNISILTGIHYCPS